MTTRDELADLIEDTIGTGYTGRVVEAAADAILARWRLVPVESGTYMYETEGYCAECNSRITRGHARGCRHADY